MISAHLRDIFSQAILYARKHKDEYLTIEHIFLILLDDEYISGMLNDLGIDLKYTKDSIKEHIRVSIPKLPDGVEDEPIESVTLSTTVENMIAHTQSSGRGQAQPEDMFVAILKNEKAYATFLLKQQGLERVDLLEEISAKDEEEEDESDSSNSVLEENSTELVALAKSGEIDPVIGRLKEISRAIEILSRRKKNNPILVGEPGVGKTAIAEGLALQIASGDVPNSLKETKIYSLDMGSLIAGTKYRGDFEKKLKSLLKEVVKIKGAIVFIDEIHTVIGAGSVGGSAMDASNILKPLLSSGKLRCIGATTYEEYRNDFSKDKAFNRRFAKIDINEPSIDDAIIILEGLKGKYEEFHNVKYSKKAIQSAVNLSKKFINDRFLPDSAIDVIDEVGATKKLSSDKKEALNITVKDIESTISKMANVPTKSATKSDITLLRSLENNMKKRIFGQDEAIEKVIKAIKINRAGLGGEDKPIGSFLFSGPTGVGKTEVARELSKQLGIHFERFDMSEYMEAHTVSRLIGAPAGYVGFEKGGLLTEAIRKHPHCVLLLDEIEKAHPDLMSLLLQVMDNAELTDNNGSKADFKNVILIMTSNLGSNEAGVMGFTTDTSLNENKAINKFFAPEFRNRLDGIVSFSHLLDDVVVQVVGKFIDDLSLSLKEKNIEIKITLRAKKYIANKGYDKAMGARPLNRVISTEIKEKITDEILFGKLKSGGVVKIDFKSEKLVFEFIK
jgi:ATP-dependent Clp protease ATP-binding subunit ClpA